MSLYLILWHGTLTLGFLVAVFLASHVIRTQRNPAGAFSWLLLIVLFPYLGVPLYLAFGGRKISHQIKRKAAIRLPRGETVPLSSANSIDRLLRRYGLPGATRNNTVELLPTGEAIYHKLVELIESAAHSIYIETFIFADDAVGRDIVERLARRAREGVQVRLLLDDVGCLKTPRSLFDPLVEAGGRIAFFMPVLHLPFRGRTNLRNHRKIAVADERRVVTGGTNIALEYIGPKRTPGRWQDLSVSLEGPCARLFTEIFRHDWMFASGEWILLDVQDGESEPPRQGDRTVHVIPSGPDVPGDPLYDGILSAIFTARRRLWVVTPYFIPDDTLCQALTLAAMRGVDVRILLPRRSNHLMADMARRSYLRQVQAAGGKILLYDCGMVHAKAMLVDELMAQVGSANMDMRSLYLNYEAVVFTYSKQDVLATEEWMVSLMADARTGVSEAGYVLDTVEGAARMLAPLL